MFNMTLLGRWSPTARPLTALVLVFALLLPALLNPAPVKAAPAVTSLSPATGSMGDTVTLAGRIDTPGGAFRVRWDTTTGAILNSGAASAGSTAVNSTFNVPEWWRGPRSVFLEDVTAARFSPAATFTVKPKIGLSASSGPVGTKLGISGAGYLSWETGIVVTYGGSAVAGALTASLLGSWTTTFVIPPGAAGPYAISAEAGGGSSTPAVSFTIVPSISLSAQLGSAGARVEVTGTGFRTAEAGITITWDTTTNLASDIRAGGDGSWGPVTITIPATTPGTHFIDAFGLATTVAEVADRSFQTTTLVFTVSPTSGHVGQEVTVGATGFRPGETDIVVTFASTAVKTGLSADASGAWSTSVIVPEGPSGAKQNIDAYGSVTGASAVPDVAFSVTPRLTISPTAGALGATVTANATGFQAGESGITIVYDGAVVKSGIAANSLGSWSSMFAVPAAPSGKRSVDAYGKSTSATSVPDVTFSQNANITISPSSGASGTTVTVSGTGFSAGEVGIAVTCGDIAVKSGVLADNKGSWTTTFAVPAMPGGTATVDASGSSTPASAVPDISFAVRPQISVSPASGAVGARVTVTGTSFGANESGIAVTYEGAVVTSSVNAGGSGDWTVTFTVPPSPVGHRKIDAYGNTTGAADITDINFTVSPAMTPTPALGNVGTSVALNGTGFGASKTVSITYDGVAVSTNPSPLTTSSAGSFTATLKIPRSKAGARKIRAADADGNSLEATWTMEGTLPPPPTLVSPKSGARISMTGNVRVAFDWSDVADASGVYYNLQVDTRADFTTAFIKEDHLTSSTYTTKDKLARGSYYWRVKAVDGAYNESLWSRPSPLKVGLMPLWTLAVIIVVAPIAVVGAIVLVSRRLRQL